jgi:glycosyltransferase involved in cell wall biosynthesis
MVRLVHLAGYSAFQSGSYIPMLRGILAEGQGRGWNVEAAFPHDAAEREWLGQFGSHGIATRLAPDASRLGMTRWVSELLAESDDPTIVHTHFTRFDLPAVRGARGRPQTWVFWHLHTVLEEGALGFARNAVKFRLFANRVEEIFCPADNIVAEAIRRGAPKDRVTLFPSPIDMSLNPLKTDGEKRQAREELGVPQDARVLLHFGRDWLLKGGDTFFQALELLQDEPGPRIVGMTNNAGQAGLEERDRMGLSHDVAYCVGPVPDQRTLHAAADLLVAPSRGEGMPFVLVEALCAGSPVVASDLPGNEFLARELDACTTVPREAALVADAAREMLRRDPDRRAAEISAARDWIGEHLAIERVAGRLIDRYQLALDSAG